MLAYKCKSLCVLWNRIIIVLIYQPCTVPREAWKRLAKKGLYFQQKNRFAELHKKRVGIIRDASCFLLGRAWGLHLVAGRNVITSPLVMSKIKVYRTIIESVTWWTHKDNFPLPLWGCGHLRSHWLCAFPDSTEAFWDTEQNSWTTVQHFKSTV